MAVLLDAGPSTCEIGALPHEIQTARYRAYQLLRRQLPLEEQSRLDTFGEVRIKGRSGAEYWISSNTQTAVYERGRQIAWTCLQPTLPLPCYDRMLIEYLLLLNDEEQYMRTANKISGRARMPLHPFWAILFVLVMVCIAALVAAGVTMR